MIENYFTVIRYEPITDLVSFEHVAARSPSAADKESHPAFRTIAVLPGKQFPLDQNVLGKFVTGDN